MDYEKKYNEALERAEAAINIAADKDLVKGVATTIFPELRESEDEKIRRTLVEYFGPQVQLDFVRGVPIQKIRDWLEKQKEQKPIIQDVELNDAVYDYVRDHFIAGADFTPEYIKKLMENAFFAGVDYYLLKQESESCESDTNVEKVIEDVIRVYGKTQGEWVGGYDVDTLIVNLRRAFNKKEQKPAEPSDEELVRHPPIAYTYPSDASRDEQLKMALLALLNSDLIKVAGNKFTKQDLIDWVEKRQEQEPAEWSEEDERKRLACIATINDVIDYECERWEDYNPGKPYRPITKYDEQINWLKSLPMRCPKTSDNWKPSEELIGCLERVIAFKHPEPEDIDGCNSLIEQLKKLM